jgi:hypothetical protein
VGGFEGFLAGHGRRSTGRLVRDRSEDKDVKERTGSGARDNSGAILAVGTSFSKKYFSKFLDKQFSP